MGDARGISPMRMTGNIAENWQMWRSRFENYLKTTEVSKKSQETQCAQLLHYIGKEGFKIYKTFTLTEVEKDKLQILLEKFEAHFLPKENLSYERYVFFTTRQKGGQSLEQFVVELTEQAQKCKLGDLQNSLIKCMITCGVQSNEMREKLLQDDSLTLEEAIHQCKVMGKAKMQSKVMEAVGETSSSGTVDLIKTKKTGQVQVKGGKSVYKSKDKLIVKCTKCGKNHNINKCPAYGKYCTKCNKKNHFAIVCKSRSNKKLNEINENEDKKVDTLTSHDRDEYLFIGAIENKNNEEQVWFTEVEINNVKVKFKVDTGAECDVLPVNLLKSIGLSDNKIKPTTTLVKSYTGDKLQVKGTCTLSVKKNDRMYRIDFYIVNTNTPALLGLTSCLKLKIIKKIDSISENDTYREIVEKYKDIFSGIGCLMKPYHIKLKENAHPVIHPTRRVALSLLDKLKKCIEELVKDKIIEKVEKATDWVNALVITRKPNGSLRICLDPKDLNNNIKREQCLIPTLDEITAKLSEAKVFSTLDATSGFYQIVLDKESTDLCTFGTPFGRYKFLRLPYGIKSAPEVFQNRFKQIFENCEGCDIYIDDIIVYGKNKIEHDERLRKVLKTAKKNNVKFNLKKCQFGKNSIKYMGHIISAEGITLDESKIIAIKELQTPKCKEDVQRVLGMLTYVSKFITNFSSETAPLRNLLKKDVIFTWGPEQEKALESLKNKLLTKPVLQFYNVNKEVVISVDSSKSGVGAVLLQNNLPCAYASRALTETQQRYAQIEKEMAAICFGLNKFHEYVYGKKVTVETDHQPLISIFKKALNKCPPRLQRMLLQIQKYDIELKYKPGKQLIIADTLSRAYINEKGGENFDNEIKAQVCLITSELNVTKEKLQEITTETQKDEELINLKKVIQEGWHKNHKKLKDLVKPYAKFKDELTICNDLIFKGSSLVIPYKLRKDILNKIHYSHLGLKKCLSLAKQSVFWPTMANEIKQIIESCSICIKYSRSQMSEELKSHKIKMIPWNKVGCDLFELRGKKYLLIIDYYSKFLEIEKLGEDTSSSKVVDILKATFARYGIPLIVVSDGGPQFSSYIFKKFAKEWEFTHILTSPTYAQSNGMAERNVQTAKKMFKKVLEEQKDIYLALLHYRNTPILENISPSQILMSRKLRSTIPTSDIELQSKIINKEKLNKTLKENEKTQQYYYNKKGVKTLSELQNGSNVVVQLKPRSNWTPGIVIRKVRDRTYLVKINNGSEYIRNRKFIKINKYKGNNKNHYLFNRSEDKDENETKKCYIEIQKDPGVREENEQVEEEGESQSRNSELGDLSESEDSTVSAGEDVLSNADSGSEEISLNSQTPIRTRVGRVVKRPRRLDL